MTTPELITQIRQSDNGQQLLPALIPYFAFSPHQRDNGTVVDNNLDFRTEVVEALLHDFTLVDIHLIRALFREELHCEAHIQRHDNLYQLCYYLYALGQLEDVFLIYEAKFKPFSMDAGTILDREMLYLGHPIDIVINYVKAELQKRPELLEIYPTILQELSNLKKRPDYGSVTEYSKFIRSYFFGHEDKAKINSPSPDVPAPKPWWKIW